MGVLAQIKTDKTWLFKSGYHYQMVLITEPVERQTWAEADDYEPACRPKQALWFSTVSK